MLREQFGLLGVEIPDPTNPARCWTVVNVYAPIRHRRLGGIRVRLEDQKGFVGFCNQRDLELLIGLAKPGNHCLWLDEEYPEMDSDEFYGICADDEDLEDDLFERELALRAHQPGVLPEGLTLTRKIHLSSGRLFDETDMVLYDCDPVSGYGPDPRFDTLMHRWTRVGRERLQWNRIRWTA